MDGEWMGNSQWMSIVYLFSDFKWGTPTTQSSRYTAGFLATVQNTRCHKIHKIHRPRGQPSFQASPGCYGISERKLGAKFCQPEVVGCSGSPYGYPEPHLLSLLVKVFLFQRCYGVAMANYGCTRFLETICQGSCKISVPWTVLAIFIELPALGFLSYKRCYKYL